MAIRPVEQQRQPSELTCPYCRDDLAEAASPRSCAGCQAVYHAACWTELGGCATLGCEAQAIRQRPTAEATRQAPNAEATRQLPSAQASPQALLGSYRVQGIVGTVLTLPGLAGAAISVHALGDLTYSTAGTVGLAASILAFSVGLALLVPVLGGRRGE